MAGPPFNYWDLGNCQRGDVWRVELDKQANVFLVDSSNYSSFKAGRSFNYRGGGRITKTPHDFVIPSSGRWYIVAHSWGLRDAARVSLQKLSIPQAMPAATPQIVDLRSIARNAAIYPGADDVPPIAPENKEYDVFISHASEDKEALVRPLAHALRDEGLTVWFDEFELRVGSSLRRSIDMGLARSRFGIVVLSGSFFQKGWTNYELDGLVTRDVASGGGQIILPIWHRVTKDEVIGFSPSLADRVALNSSQQTVEEMAHEIANVVRDALEAA
jgi:hypothetical protein